jgi:uncharacterized repeat protein (TIGR01451 family)
VEYVDDSSGFTLTEPVSGTLVWEVSPDPVPSSTLGGSFILTGWVTMDPAMSGPLVNDVQIGSDTPDRYFADNDDQWSTELLLPDLGVGKSGPLRATYDSTITYTIVYSNGGDTAAVGVVITDILPAGVSYWSDDSGLLHEEPVTGTHVWQVGPVSPGGGSVSFHVVAKVGSSTQVSLLITNTVRIGATSPDRSLANNERKHTTSLPETWLYLPLVFRTVGR